ncbi:MAG TPA: 3-oxoacyl-[acyl-carrier-protein] synthase III C-terminal domain-containing protein, partial [Patescibacteria group bacterium]|nr:3-oxoacyl-[acyl-carrier-protein] synthase III C-terminal domain-containing protein [Patescibacteria group bacterium]
VPAGEQDMAWRIGDQGFDIALSSYVPKLIGSNIRELVGPALTAGGLRLSDIDTWAVHPGGKSIIDQVQRTLGLSADQVSASREVLRKCGNMSSATILFVLDEILKRPSEKMRERVCAVAFGPGLTVEMATLSTVHAGSPTGAGVPGIPNS